MNHVRNIKEMLSIPTGSRWIAYHYFSPTENSITQDCCQWFSTRKTMSYHLWHQFCMCFCVLTWFLQTMPLFCVFFTHQTSGGKTIDRNGATSGYSSFTDSQIFFGSQFWPENSQGLSQDMSVSSRTSQQSSQEVRSSNIINHSGAQTNPISLMSLLLTYMFIH